MNKKRNQGINNSDIDDFEMRVSDLENQMSAFTVFISNDVKSRKNKTLELTEIKE